MAEVPFSTIWSDLRVKICFDKNDRTAAPGFAAMNGRPREINDQLRGVAKQPRLKLPAAQPVQVRLRTA